MELLISLVECDIYENKVLAKRTDDVRNYKRIQDDL